MPFADSQEQESESHPARRKRWISSQAILVFTLQTFVSSCTSSSHFQNPETRQQQSLLLPVPTTHQRDHAWPCAARFASENTVPMASSGMRCWRPAAAAAVLCKDPNSSWDLLVQVKQEKAAEPIRLWLLWLDQVQLHICFKPEGASLEKLPNTRVVCWSGSPQWNMWLLGESTLIWFLKRCVQRGSEISTTPHCTVRKEETLVWWE